jgi:hypothetical protein
VRDAIDVFLSRGAELDEFSHYYLKYIEYIKSKDFPIIKYEDLCDDTHKTLVSIYSQFNLNTQNITDNLNTNNKNVVGDIYLSRGNKLSNAVKMNRKYASLFLRKKINSNHNLKKANKLLSYNTRYEDSNSENIFDYIKYRILRKINNITRKKK